MKMSLNVLKNRLVRIKAMRLVDPWGDKGLVIQWDMVLETVWLRYDGLPVPFERSMAELVDAANGVFRTDKAEQFTKRVVLDSGLTVALEYEREACPSEG